MPSRFAVVLCYLILFHSFFLLHFSLSLFLSLHDKMRAQIKLSRLALLPKDIIFVWVVCYGFQSAVSSVSPLSLSPLCVAQDEDWEIGLIVLKFMSFFWSCGFNVIVVVAASSWRNEAIDTINTTYTHSFTVCVFVGVQLRRASIFYIF